MLGKPIAVVDMSDLDRLIRDEVPEGRLLEYKEAVPVSPQRQKELTKTARSQGKTPVDEAVERGTGIGDYGRNAILGELVVSQKPTAE